MSTFKSIKRPSKVSPAKLQEDQLNKSKEASGLPPLPPHMVCALQRTKSSLRQKIELQNRVTVLTNPIMTQSLQHPI